MRFGRFAIDDERFVLSCDGRPLEVAPKSVELLTVLVHRAGDIISKRELLDALWPQSVVEEANLTQHVYVLRKALRGCDASAAEAIVTVPKRGYRFILPPAVAPSAVATSPTATSPTATSPTTTPPAATAATGSVGIGSPRTAFQATASRNFATPHTASSPRGGAVSGPPLPTRRSVVATWPRVVTLAVLVATTLGVGRFTAGFAPWRAAAHPPLSASGAETARLGRYYLDLRTATGVQRSRVYFTRTIQSDPWSATGYAGLADAYSITANYRFGSLPATTYLRRATVLARRAVALDPESSEAHASLGAIASFRGDSKDAERELRRAIALDPADAPAHHWLGTVRFDEGDFDGSIRELETALRMNPVSTASSAWLEMASYFVRRYDTTIDYGRRTMELDPSRHDSLRELGLAYAATGRYAAALATFRKIPASTQEYRSVPYLIASVYARSGRPGTARRMLQQQRRLRIVDAEMPFALLALGETRAAARAAASVRFTDCADRQTFVRDPRLDAVRHDARFGRFLREGCGRG